MLGEFPRSVVGYNRVHGVLDTISDTTYGEGRLVPSTRGVALEVDHLTYTYEAGQVLLDGVDFTVGPGRTVAVVGATASGKSTLTSLVTRLVDPLSGAIRVDGQDLRDLAPGQLAAHVSLVPQSAFLFDDTVRDNVTLGAEINDDDVWEALRTAQADGFVAALPHGLDSKLGERGTTLSGGQRQRLSLARALVRHPRLLVLDDATSAVDPEVEARILAAMRQRGGDSTLLVIAYRKATIALADEVLFLSGGRVVDRGTHQQLLDRNPAYATLVNAYESEGVATMTVNLGPEELTDLGTSVDSGDEISAMETIKSGLRFSPELGVGFGWTLLLALIGTGGRVVVPDRGAADPRQGHQRAERRRRLVRLPDGGARGARDRGDRHLVVLHDRAAVHGLRARSGDPAHQGVPARPRPAAAHPEHRAPRRAGLAGHQ